MKAMVEIDKYVQDENSKEVELATVALMCKNGR